jgi:hypothetical protein
VYERLHFSFDGGRRGGQISWHTVALLISANGKPVEKNQRWTEVRQLAVLARNMKLGRHVCVVEEEDTLCSPYSASEGGGGR